MKQDEFARKLDIHYSGEYSANDKSFVIDLPDSEAYGEVFIQLDDNPNVQIIEDNQVITVQDSSILYEGVQEPFLVNLISNWDEDIYQVVITRME